MDNSQYNIDKLSLSSQYGTYTTFQSYRVPFTISGSIPNNYFNYYGVGFNFTNDYGLARCYIENAAGLRAPLNVGRRIANYSPSYEIYDFVSSEVCETDVRYENDGQGIDVLLFIYNQTGASINLITQTLYFVVEFYQAPVEA